MSEIISSVRSRLFDNHVVLLVDKSWVFDEAIYADLPIWTPIDQIFFKNNSRIQNLIFAVPCWVGQFRIESLLSENSYLRILIVHGTDLSVVMRAINQFMALYTQVVAKVIPKHQDWTDAFLCKMINSSLKGDYNLLDPQFFRYEKAHHRTLSGKWLSIYDGDSDSLPPAFLRN